VSDEPGPGSARLATGWRRLTGDALVYIGATAFTALVPFLILPLMTRWLGPQDFGIVAGFLALANLTALVVGLSTHGLISVIYYRDGASALPPQVGACFATLTLTGVPVLAGLYVLSGPIHSELGISARWLWTVWLAACGQFSLLIALGVWQATRQPWRFGATQLGFALLTAGGAVALVGGFGWGWAGRALGQAAGAGVMMIVCPLALSRARMVDWKVSHWNLRPTLRFGLGLLPHSAGAVAMTTVDRFALSSTTGAAATGQYFAAMQIASITVALASAFNTAWIPWLYERLSSGDEAAKRQVVRATYLLYTAFLSGAAALALFARPIVHVVAGPGYEEAAAVLRLLAPAAAFSGMYYLAAGYVFYVERTSSLSKVTITAAIIQAGLTFSLANAYGTIGVASATLISAMLYWIMTTALANRLVPMPWLGGRALPAGPLR
jgi:O-antigen/teichoic acid export membrane protein